MTQAQESASRTLGGLPAARRVALSAHKIELATVEVRFVSETEAMTPEAGLQLRQLMPEALGLVRLQAAQEQQLQFSFGPGGALGGQTEARARGWQLFTPDNGLAVTVFADKLLVQTPRYARWRDSLLQPLAAVLAAVTAVQGPQLVERVGLRYINRLTDESAESVQTWSGRVRDEFLGPSLHPVFGPKVTQAQQQIELALEDEAGAIVRHGPFRDLASRNSVSYLLDIDAFDQSARRFAEEEICAVATNLNRTAFSIFQLILTDEYLQTMDPVEINDLEEAPGQK